MGTRIGIAAAVLVVLAVVLAILFAKPVIGWYQQRTADAEAREERATDDAVGRKLEVEGTQELTTAAGDLSAAVADLKGTANALDRRTRADPAARTSLPPGVVDRLREHDRILCAGPVVCPDDGAAAKADGSELGEGALPPLNVARE